MKLDYAFLAERAAHLDDGRLVVFGGDVDLLEVGGLPIVFQTTLAARMLLEEGESPDNHSFGVALSTPDGERRVVSEGSQLNAPRTIPEGMPGGAGLIVGLTVGIRQAGIYWIHLIVDGAEVKSLPFKVCLATATEQS